MVWKPRHSVLASLFCAYLLCYMDRMVMASAIPFIAREFHLSALAMGGVLSSFFVGYALMQIPGGLLADRFGPNRVMTIAILCWSAFTALTGVASSLTALLVIRVLFGLSEGPFPPTASKTIAMWFPREEVGRANGLQLAAVNVGAAVAPILVAPLIIVWGWRSVFFSLLLPGLLLALVVRFYVKDVPHQRDIAQSPGARDLPAVPITEVLKTPALLWCAVTLFFTNIAHWGLMNWLPTYLLQERGFGIARMGVFASLPFISGAIGYYLGGWVADRYFERRRHVPILFGLLSSGAMTYLAAVAPSGEWAVAALMPAFLFLSIASAGLFTLPLVLAPRHAVGAAFGLVNTVGQVAAFLSPLLIGYLLTVSQGDFTQVFYCIVGLFALAAAAVVPICRIAGRRT